MIAPDTSSSNGFQGTPFAGVFDGNGYTISNLTIDTAGVDHDYFGLFGRNYYGRLIKCYTTGSVTSRGRSRYFGSLCGLNQGDIINCYTTSSVTGGDNSKRLGGLFGRNIKGSIRNCYATSMVTGGYNSEQIGGLCGTNEEGSFSVCYFLDTTGPDNGYGTPLSDPNMRMQDSFISWDFVGEEDNGTEEHWQLCFDGYDYPRLAWQFSSPADFLHPGRVDNYDLFVLTHDWLATDSRCCDIALTPVGDGVVNLFDYLEFAKYWLEE